MVVVTLPQWATEEPAAAVRRPSRLLRLLLGVTSPSQERETDSGGYDLDASTVESSEQGLLIAGSFAVTDPCG